MKKAFLFDGQGTFSGNKTQLQEHLIKKYYEMPVIKLKLIKVLCKWQRMCLILISGS